MGETTTTATATGEFKPTACILCECNCGIEVRLGGEDGRRFERIRGDKAHPSSQGYTCEKALRLDHYQNGRGDRVRRPLRRRPDGTFEEIDWDTAIREVAGRLLEVRDTWGGESIFYYGGGGQGNHLCGAYGGSALRAFGSRYRSNALAQEKTGEFWVNGKVLGTYVKGDFHNAEVAVFVGKNPYQSHSFPRARPVLKEIARDPDRSIIVIDPVRTETAELADIHLQVRPGCDAWLLAALLAVLVEEGLIASEWLDGHAVGLDETLAALGSVPIPDYCAVAGVDEPLVRAAARRIARASSVSVYEDLGVQQNLHSTLVSYLEKLVWLLTGNLGRPGTQNAPSALVKLASSGPRERGDEAPRSPVAGARIISGLVPGNVVAEEILTDHPRRYRAMFVESANPAHSLADSSRMREALDALDLVVVVDVFMTETARRADYVLPVPTQFEKYEATFFNFEFPENVFHLRHPVLAPPPDVDALPEPEIHARLVEAAGLLDPELVARLRHVAETDREAFAPAFLEAAAGMPDLVTLLLYRTLGPTLPEGAAAAAALWGAAQLCALHNPGGVARAGYGSDERAGERLFEAILTSPSGVVITVDEHDETWRRVEQARGTVQLAVPELLDELRGLASEVAPGSDPEWPFVLSAGERRSFTANTIIRDPAWRKRDPAGSLRMNPDDALRLGVTDGEVVRIRTRRGSGAVPVEVHPRMQPGHVSLPNGLGVDHREEDGQAVVTGVAPNELTASADRDPWAGTPWHKHVPARVERLEQPAEPEAVTA
jgi:anaerobic selenocysteine-containing dehydrogenase